jgi:hypothetical protein
MKQIEMISVMKINASGDLCEIGAANKNFITLVTKL